MDVDKKLKEARLNAGLTQEYVADKIRDKEFYFKNVTEFILYDKITRK